MGTSVERGAGSAFLASGRPQSVRDALYGSVRLSGWAVALLATPPFRRLAGISLSDVPGELLFRRPFPSRLDHAIGVYSLARLARPRDRAVQAAALAHDLGHGPLSHLTEPLMRERLGIAHEERSAALLGDVRAAVSSLPSSARAQLDWIDWNEVAALVLGKERGALLNGRLDYDNADNVARFLLASELGVPEYDPRALVAGLRLARAHTGANAEDQRVYLSAEAEPAARAWQRDRTRVYAYLHAGHRNLALHAMLRKAVDLGAATGILPSDFFDLTDRQALRLLGSALDRGLAELVREAQAGAAYICVWEAVVEGAGANPPVEALVAGWRERLALEAHLAAESALPAAAVVSDLLTSSASRALPPIGAPGDERVTASDAQDADDAPATPAMLRLFAPASTGHDYLRRMRLAAERCFVPLGVVPVAVEP
ncbi:MAG TPA: HD domain-containing protein [Ktedonobacterales bacterium]